MNARQFTKVLFAGLVATAVAATWFGADHASAQTTNLPALPSASLQARSPDATEITGIARQRGHVRVIVEFASPGALRPEPEAIASFRTRIAALQDAIIARQFGSAAAPRAGQGFARGLKKFGITPGFAVNVTQQELEALALDPGVLRISYDRAVPPVLTQSVPLVGMTNAYNNSNATGLGQAVVVLDTGVQNNHEFLAGKVVAEACFSNSGGGGGAVSLCPNTTPTQTGAGAASPNTAQCINGSNNICTHGTHVAGIAAGANTGQSAGEPPNGVAKNGSIVAVQVFSRFNNTSDCGGSAPCVLTYSSDQISGLEYAFDNLNLPGGIKIASVNMSLGGGRNFGTCDNSALKSPIDSLRAAGVLTAIASGNDGFKSSISSPGCISTAVTVGSTSKTDVISSFSNMSNVVDVLAPGGSGSGSCTLGANNNNILASVPNGVGSTTTYACLAGTSMATPHVAGAIAAIRTACPSATASAIESALISTGTPVADTRPQGTITKNRINVDLAVLAVCGGAAVLARPDFNADGKADILWRNSNTGNVAIWAMNGAQVTTFFNPGGAGSEWRIVGTGDFNGDGKSDVLWRDANGGNVAIWQMNGGQVGTTINFGAVGLDWKISGTGDFDGDGKTDILWRNINTGEVWTWGMNGDQLPTENFLGTLATAWQIAGTGDLGGDGKADIVFRHSTGQVRVWQVNGATITSNDVGFAATDWQINGVGDLSGDSKADILWRHNSGQVLLWQMNAAQVTAQTGVGFASSDWTVENTADFGGDGKADILWRHSSGALVLWQMNGATVASNTTIANVPVEWQVQDYGTIPSSAAGSVSSAATPVSATTR